MENGIKMKPQVFKHNSLKVLIGESMELLDKLEINVIVEAVGLLVLLLLLKKELMLNVLRTTYMTNQCF